MVSAVAAEADTIRSTKMTEGRTRAHSSNGEKGSRNDRSNLQTPDLGIHAGHASLVHPFLGAERADSITFHQHPYSDGNGTGTRRRTTLPATSKCGAGSAASLSNSGSFTGSGSTSYQP